MTHERLPHRSSRILATVVREYIHTGEPVASVVIARRGALGVSSATVRNVLVFGGGYDPDEDTVGYVEDNVGVGVYMVDALNGNLLWRAGPDDGANLRLTDMKHAIPGDVRVIDLTGDGYADRMYAADMGGRVWRFDIHNGQDRDNLVTGGVFASLGNAHLATHPAATTRRFYSAPDVSFLSSGGRTWINVALGYPPAKSR